MSIAKYRIGQEVYVPIITSRKQQVDCPDCLNTKKWKVTTPAGEEIDMTCPRCADTYGRTSLIYELYDAEVKPRTIGQITEVNQGGKYKETRYMCPETGVGSGTSYVESMLYETREEALKKGRKVAVEKNVQVGVKNRSRLAVNPSETWIQVVATDREKTLDDKLTRLREAVEAYCDEDMMEDIMRLYYG